MCVYDYGVSRNNERMWLLSIAARLAIQQRIVCVEKETVEAPSTEQCKQNINFVSISFGAQIIINQRLRHHLWSAFPPIRRTTQRASGYSVLSILCAIIVNLCSLSAIYHSIVFVRRKVHRVEHQRMPIWRLHSSLHSSFGWFVFFFPGFFGLPIASGLHADVDCVASSSITANDFHFMQINQW